MAKNSKPLPKWMLKSSNEKKDKTQVKESETEAPKLGLRQTVYFLSEKELLDTAKELLVQAGRGEIITDLEQKKNRNSKRRKLNISSKERPSDPNTSSSSPYKRDTDSPDIFSDLSAGSDDNQNMTNSDKKNQRPNLSDTHKNIDSELKKQQNSVDKAKKHKPDLSVLDEIFS
ncbi:hypothetical protein LOTGIDRAFT_159627 [Lottia gigantea]|uniref:Uncharacterized protein n=1 Tax=Lottia gigantea TaxID=225164 RepID=V4C5K7_LOTGI|nr:hypothetical protein LOTGIDRAFT_159627 [Lottia gigantea]ESO96879.1 hypothetical protein LOTGIDRAFT_159627 [Lottia gigantea]